MSSYTRRGPSMAPNEIGVSWFSVNWNLAVMA